MRRTLAVCTLLAATLLGCDAIEAPFDSPEPSTSPSAAAPKAIVAPPMVVAEAALPTLPCAATTDAVNACTMHASMARLDGTLAKKDWFALAAELDLLTKLPADERFPHWVSIARDTRDAARSAELAAVKAGCRGCHEAYKRRWRTIEGNRPAATVAAPAVVPSEPPKSGRKGVPSSAVHP